MEHRRVKKACHCGADNHALHLRPRAGQALDAEVLVVAGAGAVCLIVGRAGAEPIVVEGAYRLRQVAKALLEELGGGR
jgi:hypothetical protein